MLMLCALYSIIVFMGSDITRVIVSLFEGRVKMNKKNERERDEGWGGGRKGWRGPPYLESDRLVAGCPVPDTDDVLHGPNGDYGATNLTPYNELLA